MLASLVFIVASLKVSCASPIDQIRLLDHKFCVLYNTGDFDGVVGMYTDEAVLIPPSGDTFISGKNDLKGFFKAAASGNPPLTNLTLEPVTVKEDDDGMTIHEIGNVTHSLEPEGGAYYVMWKKEESQWKIATDVMAIEE